MSRMHTWSNTPEGGESHEFSIEMPTDHTETDLIAKRFGTEERAFECAARQTAVDLAPKLKKFLARGDIAGAERCAENSCNDGTRSTEPAAVIEVAEAEERGISAEDIAWLATKGVKLT